MDHHVSGRVVGGALAEDGHDVRTLDSERKFEGLADRHVLSLAASEGRVLVTANAKDFMVLATGGEEHAGMVLVPSSVPTSDFGALIHGIRQALADTGQEDWVSRVEWLRKR